MEIQNGSRSASPASPTLHRFAKLKNQLSIYVEGLVPVTESIAKTSTPSPCQFCVLAYDGSGPAAKLSRDAGVVDLDAGILRRSNSDGQC